MLAHLGDTSAIIGAPTTEQLQDLVAGAGVVFTGDVLDRTDEIGPSGTDVGQLKMAYTPPALTSSTLVRRPTAGRPLGGSCNDLGETTSLRTQVALCNQA